MTRLLACGIAILIFMSPAHGEMTAAEAFAQGNAAGGIEHTQSLTTSIGDNKGVEVLGSSYSTTPPSQSSYWQGAGTLIQGIYTSGQEKIGECATTGLDSPNAADKQHCEAVDALAKQPSIKPTNLIDKNDPLIQVGKAVVNDPEAIAGSIDSAFSNCTTTTTTIEAPFTVETCNEWSVNEEQVCTAGQEVVVDPDYLYGCHETIKSISPSTCTYGQVVEVQAGYNYQCKKNPASVENYSCNRRLIVTCDPVADGCDNGGIIPGSTQGDMRVWFGPWGGGTYGLEFGTFADNYWGGNPATYDRSLTFTVGNKDAVTQFALVGASFDDWLWVKINDQTVYIGPYGGDRLYVIEQGPTLPAGTVCQQTEYNGWYCYQYGWNDSVVSLGYFAYCSVANSGDYMVTYACTSDGIPGQVRFSATQVRYAELGTSWSFSLNIDLRKYLVNGTNVIWTRTIVAGYGESGIRISARMLCPRGCYDSWDNQCAALEARSL